MKDKKKILIITTGGTIACTSNDEGLVPTLKGERLLSYLPNVKDVANIDVEDLVNIDSSNMQPEHWILIAKAIHRASGNYDGIVVLHGTDTMAYTSSALSFMTLGARIPVIITGSQIPIFIATSDGRKNLYDAILVACNSGLQGVFVVFDGNIINGCCASKIDTESYNAFQSVNGKNVGFVDGERIEIHSVPCRVEKEPLWNTKIDPRVLLWKLTPGVSPDLFDKSIESYYRIVILEAFGVGGLPMLKNSFLPVINEWRSHGILTVVTTQCYHGKCDMTIYETGRLALNKGAVCAGNMTREALLTKLMWILSFTNNIEEIINRLSIEYCGEFGL